MMRATGSAQAFAGKSLKAVPPNAVMMSWPGASNRMYRIKATKTYASRAFWYADFRKR